MKQQLVSRAVSGLTVALVIGIAAASTFAHDGQRSRPGDKAASMLAKVDGNHDGRISAAEHAAYAQALFARMDADHDGMVSQAELDAGMRTMHGTYGRSGATPGHQPPAASDATRPRDVAADDAPAAPPSSTP
ncbi:hypothetical protein [Cognatiluteimonas telluris]|jgi:hypothetical protein|uniref:hypothetical protein n=1 Tax=Cognatiluteimonas telluris TaxID=1104775 RepID=UPI00140CDED2|nr:hypothetical protein [Lysobacter telluris]